MARLNRSGRVKEVRRNRRGEPEQILDSGRQTLNDEELASESVTSTGAIAITPNGLGEKSTMSDAMNQAKGKGLANKTPSHDSTGQAKTDTKEMGKAWPRQQKNTGGGNEALDVSNPGKMSEGLELTPDDIAATMDEAVDIEALFAAYARQTNFVTLNEFVELCQAHASPLIPDERMFIDLMAANPDFLFEEHHDANGTFWVPTIMETNAKLGGAHDDPLSGGKPAAAAAPGRRPAKLGAPQEDPRYGQPPAVKSQRRPAKLGAPQEDPRYGKAPTAVAKHTATEEREWGFEEDAPPFPPQRGAKKGAPCKKCKKEPCECDEDGAKDKKKEWKKPWEESIEAIGRSLSEDGEPPFGDEEEPAGGDMDDAGGEDEMGGATPFAGEETPEEEAAEGHDAEVVAAAEEGEEGGEVGEIDELEGGHHHGGGLADKLGFEPLFCPLCGSELDELGDPGGHMEEEIMAAGGPVVAEAFAMPGDMDGGHDGSADGHYAEEPPMMVGVMGDGGEMGEDELGDGACECPECGHEHGPGDKFCSQCGCELCGGEASGDELAGDMAGGDMGDAGEPDMMGAGEEAHPGSIMGMESTAVNDDGLAECDDGVTSHMGNAWPRKHSKQNSLGGKQNEFGDSSHGDPKDGVTTDKGKMWPRKHTKQGSLGANQNEFGDSSHGNAKDGVTTDKGKMWPRKQDNTGGQWEPFGNSVKGGGKMGGGTKKMYENINILARQTKRFLADTARACGDTIKGCRLEYQVAAGNLVESHSHVQLAEALADVEELLQVCEPGAIQFEAGFYDRGGRLVHETRIPLRAVSERTPLTSGDLTLFRFPEVANNFAERLVNEGLACRLAAHNWGSAVVAKVPFVHAADAFEVIRESLGASVGRLTIGSVAQQLGRPWMQVRNLLLTKIKPKNLMTMGVNNITAETPLDGDTAQQIGRLLGGNVRTTDMPAYGSAGAGGPRSYH